MIKFNGIRNAVKALNKYKHVLIYFNTRTREVWANEYADAYSYTVYDDNDVYLLRTWDNMFDWPCEKLNCRTLNKIINAYIEFKQRVEQIENERITKMLEEQ